MERMTASSSSEISCSSSFHTIKNSSYLINLNNIFNSKDILSLNVSCGCNYTIIYSPNSINAIAFGANHVGQLALGHKKEIKHKNIFEQIPFTFTNSREEQVASIRSLEDKRKCLRHYEELPLTQADCNNTNNNNMIIEPCFYREFICGFNHTFIWLTNGKLFACGSNTYGELGLDIEFSPTTPKEVTFFSQQNIKLKKIAAGNSFTLFLTEDGYVYGSGSFQFGQLPIQHGFPKLIPLLRSFVMETNSFPASSAGNKNKYIKIKDIACVGTMAVYVSYKNEILLQGSWIEFGLQIRSPRLQKVSQTLLMETFNKIKSIMIGENQDNSTKFNIVKLFSGPNTLLIYYENGCIGGLGANTEGELFSDIKKIGNRKANLAPAFSHNEVLPVLIPNKANILYNNDKTKSHAPMLASGSGFTIVIDDKDNYGIDEKNLLVNM